MFWKVMSNTYQKQKMYILYLLLKFIILQHLKSSQDVILHLHGNKTMWILTKKMLKTALRKAKKERMPQHTLFPLG